MNVPRTSRRWLVPAGVLAAAAVLAQLSTEAADHRDGPIFVNTQANGRADINDIYIFQAPGNVNNTVLIFTVSPFPGLLTPTTFDQSVTFDIKVDNTGDAVEDITFRMTYGAPGTGGVQPVTVRGLPSTKFPPTGILARGNTGTNIPIAGGGMFRAAVHDDPFFFDAGQFGTFVAAGMGSPVRPVGQARNFFGPSGNVLAMIIEIPTARLRSAAGNPNVGVWVTTTRGGVQLDRMGRPAINTALIPPVPRNAGTERRNAFNAGLPRNDRRDFRNNMISILNGVLQKPRDTTANPPLTSADGLANFLLPDILTFNTNTAFTTNPADANGFPNGRRLRDDVIDTEYSLLLTAFGITSDNVPDDNGDKITDGTMRANQTLRPIAFPYIGAPNNPGTGPNP